MTNGSRNRSVSYYGGDQQCRDASHQMPLRIVQYGPEDFRPERKGKLWGWNAETTLRCGSTSPLAFATLEAAKGYVEIVMREMREAEERRAFVKKVVWP